ncbi:MAG: hypothetical protein KUG82_04475 [Pseudomonadales bacterium]|nr:hypothetical protein [Pseudomonadales bacterium]
MYQSKQNSLACINIGKLSLLFPHRDISTVESNSDATVDISALKLDWPIFHISENLIPNPVLAEQTPEPDRQVFAFITPESKPQMRFALACDQVTNIQYEESEFKQLPPLMNNADSPILGVLFREPNLHCLTDASHLATYLHQQAPLPLVKDN